MKLIVDRHELDEAFKDPGNIFLLLFGEDGSVADKVYQKAPAAVQEPWKITVLVQNLDLLTDAEKALWSLDRGSFTTLSRSHAVVDHGDIKQLCMGTNEPSNRRIQTAFARADQQ